MSTAMEYLVGVAAKGTILLAVTGLAAVLAHRARASVRHAIWAAGLTGLLLVPVLSAGLPRWEVIRLPAPATPAAAATPALAPTPANALPVASIGPTTDRVIEAFPAPAAVVAPEAAPVVESRARIAPLGLGLLALIVWGAGAGLGLLWLGVGFLRVQALVSRSTVDISPEWIAPIEEALEVSGLSGGVEFRETDASMPMATGILRPVVLLPTAGTHWSYEHRRSVVIHELAHVRRKDCLTHLGVRVACALHWFNPLAWVAARQARVEREHACDDAVLAAGALPSSYAQALLDTARQAPPVWATGAAGLMMARPSHLSNRLLAVLDAHRSRGRLGRAALGAASVGTLALIAPVAALAPVHASGVPNAAAAADPMLIAPPHIADVRSAAPIVALTAPVLSPEPATVLLQGATAPCPYNRKGTHRSVRLSGSVTISGMGSTDDGRGNSYTAWTGADCSVVVYIQGGEPTFTDDETDIASLPGNGRVRMTVSVGNEEREYEVRGSGSSLTRTYKVEGAEQPLDADARKWVANLVLQYIRQSGYHAEQRAARILKAGGVSALLQEIAQINGDYSRGKYYRAGISGRTDAGQVSALLDDAGRAVESDYEMGRILALVSPQLLGDARVRASYLAATKGMESDYEKATALLTISAGGLDQASLQTALQATHSVSSDYERGRVLMSLVKSAPTGRDLDPAFLEEGRVIDSDYEKARVLTAYAQHNGATDASLAGLYAAAATIHSSNDLANLLLTTVTTANAASRCEGYLTAARGVDSDYDKARTLLGLISLAPLAPACAQQIPDAAATITSSNDRARVLTEFTGRGLLSETTRGTFFRAARGVDSDYDKRRVLTTVVAMTGLTEAILGDVLAVATTIESDNDLASVLVAAASTGKVTAGVRPAYLRAAAGLESDFEKKRALTAIGAQ